MGLLLSLLLLLLLSLSLLLSLLLLLSVGFVPCSRVRGLRSTVAAMISCARALGVRCSPCHAGGCPRQQHRCCRCSCRCCCFRCCCRCCCCCCCRFVVVVVAVVVVVVVDGRHVSKMSQIKIRKTSVDIVDGDKGEQLNAAIQ